MDRREFFRQYGTSMGGFIVNPAPAPDTRALVRALLRPGEPINSAGHPFGGPIAAVAALDLPGIHQSAPKSFVVVGHGRPEPGADAASSESGEKGVGISVLELVREGARPGTGGWSHAVAGHGNRRWHGATATALEGARLDAGGRLCQEQRLTKGVGAIRCARALPWPSILCGEEDVASGGSAADFADFGWVVEVQPLRGLALKRFSLGRVRPIALLPWIRAGQPVAVFLLGSCARSGGVRLFKFVSHQRFDARRLDAHASALSIGELFAADPSVGGWRSLTAGLSNEAWALLLRDPHAAEGAPPALRGGVALALDGGVPGRISALDATGAAIFSVPAAT